MYRFLVLTLALKLVLFCSLVQGQVTNGTGLATIIPAIPTIVGACGVPYGPSDLVASVPTSVFQPSVCGKTVSVTSQGKTLGFKVVDECLPCNELDIDLSAEAFTQFAPESDGSIPEIDWFVQKELKG
ncbi:hypothetical protein BT96DRAFT_973207 [Gymnopus androsaceus JB14]|uniref:Uncharacterized protein n=1 Tax=Gymnopus androsaceus JB14 TaxID=1447944 RepID=A0A6A4HY81_9AGAR|nr:hypothetical protein BT96DRAFT_973207 [Gymnopus androsaceus JB14]